MLRILIADDDQGLRLSVRSIFSNSKFQIEEAFDGVDAVEKCQNQKFDIVMLDVDMPRLNGLGALKQIKENDPGIIIIMMTAYAAINDAVQAVKDGAFNYLSKPVSSEELLAVVDKAVDAHTLISNIAASAPILNESGKKIIGGTAQMQKVFNIIYRLAKVDTPVLIRGASGTGKELVARAIHFNSVRKDGKFVAINCSAIPENLFESELFGHEKGSFTGADQRKIGKFQFAEGGTLFLDEVGDMPQLMQVKLLRVLQEKLFTPVGANREIETNVRIIAATNRPLEEMMKKGSFREDLFYRLNVIPIFLPALSERRNDLDVLVAQFVRKFNQAHGKRISSISPNAMAVLKKYDWPGNIRELENVIEHAFILENSNIIGLGSLPEGILLNAGINLDAFNQFEDDSVGEVLSADQGGNGTGSSLAGVSEEDEDDVGVDGESVIGDGGGMGGDLDFNAQKEAFEKEFIIKALKAFKGRINQTALHANIPKKTLLRKIEKYGIVAKDHSE